jgi:hypothetical protein
VAQRRVRDADLARDRSEARAIGAAFREDLDRAIEDLLSARDPFGVSAALA